MTCDIYRKYHAYDDIFLTDLERKNTTGKLLVTGRTLLAMAKKGARMFCKANSFIDQKWNTSTNSPKKSGESLEDVVEFVRKSMYKLLHVSNEVLTDDENKEEDDYSSKNDEEEEESSAAKGLLKIGDSIETSIDEVKFSNIPDDYIFPGFFAFLFWGPFAAGNERLLLFEVEDAKTDSLLGRKHKRTKELGERGKKRNVIATNERGFTTDQRISMESLFMQKKAQKQLEREATMVGLIAHENAISRQVEAAERRAAIRCKVYKKGNVHWDVVDKLLKVQESAIEKIAIHANEKVDETESSLSLVTEFLREDSPTKKKQVKLETNSENDDVSES